ncbi:TPA: XRE family transcriptional regulator [Campylobacter jejuni]|uniref:acyl carrier protein n=1 Tax=Campylobacter jejuni TaxID=197 RepID=UPI000874A0A3|nr:acyl carrier protein [Campylobacter jejuni]OEV56394.1 acyl carrier protein [Campylobacter jejuni]HDZ4253984.1 XRE family transcriptional regulator [Campylobacter jejuni]HEC1677494.1 XRE family transcriptional regulator [Campylobacter jejuni]HED4615237.1 XRE family transcriptional regulator [Campylobacter jejuni]
MTYEKFESILKKCNLSKKEFALIVDMSYTSITNWKQNINVPSWVKSWLENYIKAQKYNKIKDLIKDDL